MNFKIHLNNKHLGIFSICSDCHEKVNVNDWKSHKKVCLRKLFTPDGRWGPEATEKDITFETTIIKETRVIE